MSVCGESHEKANIRRYAEAYLSVVRGKMDTERSRNGRNGGVRKI